MVIDAQLVPLLVHVLAQGEFKAQKEAAWAVSNFTVGGTAQQVGWGGRLSSTGHLCAGDAIHPVLKGLGLREEGEGRVGSMLFLWLRVDCSLSRWLT